MSRHFVRAAASACLLSGLAGGWAGTSAAATGAVASVAAGAQPPNIVFILADDLDHKLFLKYDRLHTLMARQGMSFDNHYVSLSLCCPSRTATLRGQFAHNTGVYNNDPPDGGFQKVFSSGLEVSTVATWLQAAGYRTALMGKYLNGYPTAESGLNYVPPGWSEWASPNLGTPYEEYRYALNIDGVTVHHRDAPEDYMVDVLGGLATRFIQSASAPGGSGSPYFLYIAPFAPHQPATPPQRYLNLFQDEIAPRTASFNEADISDKPSWLSDHALLDAKSIDNIDKLYRDRRRSMLAVEDLVVQVMAALQSTGQLANTYVFFASDNGYHQGQHRLRSGKDTGFEEDLHVPLLVVGPGVAPGSHVRHLTSNVDYAATFADLAGVPTPDFVDGRSLAPLLHGKPAARWRDALLLEHAGSMGAETPPASGLLEPPDDPWDGRAASKIRGTDPFIGLRTADRTTYIEYRSGDREFYNLKRDPDQLTNAYPKLPLARRKTLTQWLASLAHASGQALRDAERKP